MRWPFRRVIRRRTNIEKLQNTTSVFVVLNPNSGRCSGEEARLLLEKHLSGVCQIHELSSESSLAECIREAISEGAERIVAVGGDGTVSAVGDILANLGTNVPLGILPLGTANVLAGELGIPSDMEEACRLLTGPHDLVKIDAMRIRDRHYLTQVGVGLDALMIRDTTTEDKKRFGRLAYIWTAFSSLAGFQPRRFTLTLDGTPIKLKASQVLVANSGTLGQKPFRWGLDIRPDDGVLDVCVIRARNLFDILSLGWHVVRGRHKHARNVTYRTIRREVTIASKVPVPVQADGEIVGETPVTVRVAAGVINVLVPVANA